MNESAHIQVSIIIVNYNSFDVLYDCLLSIREKTQDVNYEIIVVDNSSPDDSSNKIRQYFPDIALISSQENLGFGRANNLAAKHAGGEYLFLLNPDTILINNAVKILYDYVIAHPETGVCGGNLFTKEMKPGPSYYDLDFYTRELYIIFNKKRKLGFNNQGIPLQTKVIIGADFMIFKQLFDEAGGFDPDFFMYYEEVELCDRIRRKGYQIVSVPDAKIIHLEGASGESRTEELKKWSYKERWYSMFIYFSKVKGNAATTFIYYLHLSKLFPAILFFSLINNKPKKDYWVIKYRVIKDTHKRYKTYLKTQ